jgi:hypothetical protein
MTVLAQLLTAAALAATAVIYGTGVFAAIVLRAPRSPTVKMT